MNRKTLSIVAAGLLTLASAAGAAHAAAQAPTDGPIQSAVAKNNTEDSGQPGETKTFGPFDTREEAENFGKSRSRFYDVSYWLFIGYYVDVTFSDEMPLGLLSLPE